MQDLYDIHISATMSLIIIYIYSTFLVYCQLLSILCYKTCNMQHNNMIIENRKIFENITFLKIIITLNILTFTFISIL